jgi:ribosome-binding factor A
MGEISNMLIKEIKDPRIGFVTILDVEVAPDLSHAMVFFTVYGSDEERENTLAGLKSTASYMRREMGRRLHLKRIPELHFRYDNSALKGEHLEGIFNKIHEEEDL